MTEKKTRIRSWQLNATIGIVKAQTNLAKEINSLTTILRSILGDAFSDWLSDLIWENPSDIEDAIVKEFEVEEL